MNLTPLIDMVFLLLVFFLVATKFAEEDHELDVKLPSAAAAQPMIVAPKEIIVNIDREGRYFLGGRQMAIDEVEASIRQAALNNPVHQAVTIRGDRQVNLQAAVAVMNACKREGLTQVSVATAE